MPPPTLSEQVYAYVNSREGQQVGTTGECFDLADLALRAAGAKTAEDYGRVTPNADYRWGRVVNQKLTTAGDVIQFRNYRMTITTVTKVTKSNGSWKETYTQSQNRPHHTAIVARVGQNGELEVLEQNVGSGKNRGRVQRNPLFFGSPAPTTTTTKKNGVTTTVKTTVQVTGTAKFYRAEGR